MKEIKPISLHLPADEEEDYRSQYERFVDEAIETEIVWNLQSEDGFALCESDQFEGKQVMPFWSREQDAKVACSKDWIGYNPNPIRFDDFVDAWLHGMDEDEMYVGVNWNEELAGVEIEPVILIEDLLGEE